MRGFAGRPAGLWFWAGFWAGVWAGFRLGVRFCRRRDALILGAAVALATTLLATGCTFAEELINMRPVEVVDYHPRAQRVTPESLASVWIEFSAEMERSVTEAAFSLAENGGVTEGRFSWSKSGRRVSFLPATPVRVARSYTLRVTTEAEDLFGNSLDRELNAGFSTGVESVAPRVLSISPANGAVLADPFTTVEIEFSEAMHRESFYRAFSIAPDLDGAIAWSPGDRIVSFTPVAPYAPGTDYEIRLESDATDASGNSLLDSVVLGFRSPAQPLLEVTSVARMSDGGSLSDESVTFLDPMDVEKDDSFRLNFSRSVPIDRRRGIITLAPSVSARFVWEGDGSSVILTPGDEMTWMEVYELEVTDKRYRFRVTGEGSRPPAVEAAYFSPSLSRAAFSLLSLGDNVDFESADDAAVDFVVSHSSEGTLALASAMEAVDVGISQGAPISFTSRDIRLRKSHPQGGELPSGETVIRVLLAVDADIPGGGIVTLTVGDNLSDSRANSLPEEWSLEVNGF